MSLSPGEISYEKAHITDDRTGQVTAANVVCCIVAILAVALRFLSRKYANAHLGADDWLLVASLVLYLAFVILVSLQTALWGFGRHVILAQNPYSLTNAYVAGEALYMMIIDINKVAILCLYGRVFPSPKFKRYLNIVGIFLVVHAITGTIGSFTQCIPLAHLWDPTIPGHCLNQLAFIATMGVFTILTDFVLLAMPLFPLACLQVSRTRRIQLIIVFCFGGLTCIVSIVRIVYAPTLFGLDLTWNGVPECIAGIVECSASFVCASMPTYRVLVNRILKRDMTTSLNTVNSERPRLFTFESFQLDLAPQMHPGWYGITSAKNCTEEKTRKLPSGPAASKEPKKPVPDIWELESPPVSPQSPQRCATIKEWAIES
ncbi:hypothetical protein MMC10_004543 [Thelotrema lepadinum]|nr:hypothetical protein [Thelotrema lepadinum]